MSKQRRPRKRTYQSDAAEDGCGSCADLPGQHVQNASDNIIQAFTKTIADQLSSRSSNLTLPSLLDSCPPSRRFLKPGAAACQPRPFSSRLSRSPPGPHLLASDPSTSLKPAGVFATPSPGQRRRRETFGGSARARWSVLAMKKLNFAGLHVHEPPPHPRHHGVGRSWTPCRTVTGPGASGVP